jgi:FAD/FMN-containing dehydrogenase
VGEDDNAVMAAASEVVKMANSRGGEGFIAVSPETRKKFWLDRARTAAISRHTNAFKVNEDVVIPLPRMGDYCDGIERMNIELSIQNKLELCDALADFMQGELPLHVGDTGLDKDELIGDRRDGASSLAGLPRSHRTLLLHAAGPQPAGVVEDRVARAAGNPVRWLGLPSGAGKNRRDSQGNPARAGVRCATYACGRWQCAYQYPGQF